MGRVGGFLEHQRRLAPRRPVPERLHDYGEIPLAAGAELVREQAARCMDCGVPFCHNGCPLGNLIPEWNHLVYRDDWEAASRRLHRTNNFPEFTGRLCPAPCEPACVLAINDEAVTIKQIEVSIVDRAFAEGWVRPEPPAYRSGRRVAVVGSGPAGLAAAQQLNRAGHWVTVYERSDRPGGLMRYGIPDFKLEKWMLDRRIDILAAEGVAFECNQEVGTIVSAEELRGRHDAVVLCIGSGVPRALSVPGADFEGVHFALKYLEQQNRRVAGDSVPGETISAAGRHVVILGGGDTGADCLGNVHREGCASVTQLELLPAPPGTRTPENPWPQWPLVMRASAAHDEGGARDFGVQTEALLGASGRVTELLGRRVAWSVVDGRPSPAVIDGDAVRLRTDLVLLAMGFVHPEHEGALAQFGVALDARGNVATDAASLTSVAGVFAAGDARRGQSLIVHAIAEGRRAAASCHAWLRAA